MGKLYVKQVRIPKGTTLVLPPPSLMSSMKSMGRQPIGYSLTKPMITGYTYKQYSSKAKTLSIDIPRIKIFIVQTNS